MGRLHRLMRRNPLDKLFKQIYAEIEAGRI